LTFFAVSHPGAGPGAAPAGASALRQTSVQRDSVKGADSSALRSRDRTTSPTQPAERPTSPTQPAERQASRSMATRCADKSFFRFGVTRKSHPGGGADTGAIRSPSSPLLIPSSDAGAPRRHRAMQLHALQRSFRTESIRCHASSGPETEKGVCGPLSSSTEPLLSHAAEAERKTDHSCHVGLS
jgi:hypothetical protein